MPSTPPPRLHLYVAREAPKILILRRGPSRVFHLISWNTETDEFEHGSWFRGRIYELRCDLSFDGEWFVYFALGPTREFWSWVALCRPPWVRAETLWPKLDSWRGGGVWTGPNQLWLNLGPDEQHRKTDTSPQKLGIHIQQRPSDYGEDEGPFYRRLERDGWQRAGSWNRNAEQKTAQGYLYQDDPGWFLKPTSEHPTLRLFYRGYFFGQGRRYEYQLDEYPDLLDAAVNWAGWDQRGRLIVARRGRVERYALTDLDNGQPSFTYDLNGLTPPPRPPRPSRPQVVEVPALPTPGPDASGRYPYLGSQRFPQPGKRTGHLLRSQADLQAITPILQATRTDAFETPQAYVVTLAGDFLLGGYLNNHGEMVQGEPVLAAGEVWLEADHATGNAIWTITAINNRSYEYMPDAEVWAAVTQALESTGISYPTAFTEVYPLEGAWADILEILRE